MFDSRIKYMMSALVGVCMMAGSAAADQLPEFWHYMGTGGEYDGVKGMIEAVNKQNPSAPVTERAVPGNAPGLRQQIQVAVMGGTPPLAYQFNMGWDLVKVAETGRVLPIDDVWQKIDGDKAFPAGLRNVVSFGGHHYAIPLAISVISDVYYNKKMFTDLGLKPPASWEDWQEICKKVEAAGKACLSHNAGFPWGLYNMYSVIISDLGIDGYWKLARGELAFNGPEMRGVFEHYGELFGKHYIKNWTGNTAWSDGADVLMRGDAAMLMAGSWMAGYMKTRGWKPGEDFDFFSAPGVKGYTIFQMDTAVALKGDREEQAKTLMASLASPEAQAALNAPKGSIAGNINTPKSIYDTLATRQVDDFIGTTGKTAVPSLLVLQPVDFRVTLGSQIERFAANPTKEALETAVETLEKERQKLIATKSFYPWQP